MRGLWARAVLLTKLEAEMEQTICVVTDSDCDLPSELVDEYEITVVPLTVHFGTEVYLDGQLSVEEFWDKARGPSWPKTSQPSIGALEKVFERLVARGKQVLCVTITGKHSGTFHTAHLAAQRFLGTVEVFDSQFISLGVGLQALAAAQAARAKRPMQEILAQLVEMRARMRLVIMLDTLENLRLGGRADGFITVAERMTRALDIKVIVNMVEGQLRLLSAARSSRSGLRRMLRLVEQLGPLEHLAVAHTRNRIAAEEMAEQLAQQTGFARESIWVRETGAALATHAGPGVIGILAVPVQSTG